MGHIAKLLGTPNKRIPSHVFFDGPWSVSESDRITSEGLTVQIGEEEMPVLDNRAISEIKKRIKALNTQRAEAVNSASADSGMIITECDEEIAQLSAQLKKYGSGKTPLSRTLKRKSDAVRKAITEAIDKIEEQSPKLAAHLRATIETGTFPRYSPTNETYWNVVE